MSDLDTRYPHPAACAKTDQGFEDGTPTPQHWRDTPLCEFVDARGGISAFSRYAPQEVEPQRGATAKTMLRTILGELAKDRSAHESNRSEPHELSLVEIYA